MGASPSQEITTVTAEVTAANKRQRKEDIRKREEQENTEKEAIEKKLAEDTSKVRERVEKELQTVRQKESENVEKENENHKQVKRELEKILGEVREEIRINNTKQIDEAKKAGLDQVTQEKKSLEEDKEKIVQKQEYIVQQMEKLSVTQKTMNEMRSEMVQKLEDEEIAKLQTHHKELHKLNDERNNVVREGEHEKHRFAEDHRDLQIQLRKQHLQLNAVQVANAHQFQTILNEDQIFEDFRRRCKQILSLFSKFKREYDQEEKAINITRDDIRNGTDLSFKAEMSDVLGALRKLDSEVEGFDCSGSNDEDKFSNLREKTKTLIEKLLYALNEIQSRIIRYEKNVPSASAPIHSRTTSVFSDLEQLEDLDSALDSSPPSVFEDNSFSIVKLKKKAKGYISELNEIMLNFNVTASTAFRDALKSQSERLSLDHSRIISQITNGPSTSSTNQISSGISTENPTQPSIEQVGDSELEVVKEPIEESENEK